jgi:hypothetical protein
MTKQVFALMVALVLVAAPAFAEDVDGQWTGTLATPMGDVPVTFTFKAEGGGKLAGSMLGMDGTQIPIANGKIDGNKISYTVTLDFGGMTLELIYRGVVSPTEIKLDGEVFGMPFDLVVKKVT